MMLDFNYGLIAVDPSNPQEILQFVGYFDYPSERDIALLRIEFKDDPDLGLQDKWDKVDILLAPDSVIEEYRSMSFNTEES